MTQTIEGARVLAALVVVVGTQRAFACVRVVPRHADPVALRLPLAGYVRAHEYAFMARWLVGAQTLRFEEGIVAFDAAGPSPPLGSLSS